MYEINKEALDEEGRHHFMWNNMLSGNWVRQFWLSLVLLCLGTACNEPELVGTVSEPSPRVDLRTTEQALTSQEWPSDPLVITNSIHFEPRGSFQGALSVTRAAGVVIANGAELSLDQGSSISGTVRADTVYVETGAGIVGTATYNTKLGPGTLATSPTPLSLPLPIAIPQLPVFSAGSAPVSLSQNEVRSLSAGTYGAVTLPQSNAGGTTKLNLIGGTYNFASISVGTDARIECYSECEVRVFGRAAFAERSYFGPAPVAGMGPGNVRLLIRGGNSGGTPTSTPSACSFGNDATLAAWTLVPSGTLRLGHRVAMRGKVVARDAFVGMDSAARGLELPIITQGPADQEVWEHQTAVFSVSVSGLGVVYQWQKNGQNVPGATASTFALSNAAVSDDGALFRVVVTNEAGSVTTRAAKLTVIPCQSADPTCDGVDEDCNGVADDDFQPFCDSVNVQVTCSSGHEVSTSCDNGVVCDGAERCLAGTCGSGPIAGLDDGNTCTEDTCNVLTDQVVHAPVPVGTVCLNYLSSSSVCDAAAQCIAAPEPFVSCVDRLGDGKLSARFGYSSPESIDTSIPLGPANSLSPALTSNLPTVFHPGVVEGAFRVNLREDSSVTWRLGDLQVTADDSYPACPVPPSGPARARHRGEQPSPASTLALQSLQVYTSDPTKIFPSVGFQDLTGTVGEPNFAPNGPVPEPSQTSVTVTVVGGQLHRSIDTICGGADIDAFADVDGQGEQRRRVMDCNWFTTCEVDGPIEITSRQVDPSLGEASLHLRGLDIDHFPCSDSSDDQIYDDFWQIDLTQDDSLPFFAGSLDRVHIDYRVDVVAGTAPPPAEVAPAQICAEFFASFVDETRQPVYRASFAEFRLRLQSPFGSVNLGADYDATGALAPGSNPPVYLDDLGCTPPGLFDPRVLVHNPTLPELDLHADFRIRTNFRTPDGRGVGVRVGDENYKGPFEPELFTDPQTARQYLIDTSSLAEQDAKEFAQARALPFAVVPFTSEDGGFVANDDWLTSGGWRRAPAQVRLKSRGSNPAIQAAAIASELLSRDLGMTRDEYLIVAGQSSRVVYGDYNLNLKKSDNEVESRVWCQSNPTICDTLINSRCMADGFCGCDNDGDCRSPDADRAPEFRSCLTVIDAAPVGVNAPAGATFVSGHCGSYTEGYYLDYLKALYLGPASAAAESPRCTGLSECPQGQECLTETGGPCLGSGCVCRLPDLARWRSVIGHEMGHHVHALEAGQTAGVSYTFECDTQQPCVDPATGVATELLFDPPSVSRSCACDHVTVANRAHCLQSLERMSDAEAEGFAHFFAASIANPNPNECIFTYYKEVRMEECPAGNTCKAIKACNDANDPGCAQIVAYSVFPPVVVPCAEANKWRNTECGAMPGAIPSALAEMGVERDWLQFLRSWNKAGTEVENASLSEIFAAYRATCDPCRYPNPTPNAPPCDPTKCDGQRFTWLSRQAPEVVEDDPLTPVDEKKESEGAYSQWQNERSYRAGIVNYYEDLSATEPAALLRRDHFLARALDRGVDEHTVP